ncbi:MAG: cell wall hydrolase [Clostridium sp.]|uniref:cell wall hydrolase n=1 Tax=Clostridium sp. TaxID=1506 RepID=UPI003D6D3EAE
MNKKYENLSKRIILAVMVLGVIMSVAFTNVYADSASDKAKIQQVQSQKKDIENKVEIMNKQYAEIMSKIKSNEINITTTQKYIDGTKLAIAKAEAKIKAEQTIFDKRMRVMYMNGTSSYIDIILDSEGINDFISRVENIKIIVTFDKKVMDGLKTEMVAINLKKVELDKANTKLLSLRVDNKKNLADLTKQKAEQNILLSQLEAQEKQYGAQLILAQAAELRQAMAAKQAVAKLKKAETKRKKDAEQALKTAEKANSIQAKATPTAAINIETNDLDLLARIITAEAGGESYSAQVAVGAVVLNRVKSSHFPNSISAVINQKTNGSYEFTPVLNGNINRPAHASAVKAAKEALSGNDPTNNALFFYSGSTPAGLTLPQPVSIIIGNLTFINML